MNWVETLNRAIDYIEDNLLDDISLSEIAKHTHISNEHLQRGFSALAGLTIGEYIRNRRLSLAGLEFTRKNIRVIDAAVKYGYETSESFSKAFSRFHGFAPSVAKQNSIELKSYSRLIIKIIMEGGSIMDYRIVEREAFEVVAKIEGLITAEYIEKALLTSWSVGGKLSRSIHLIAESENDNIRTHMGQELSHREVPEGFKVWQVPEYTWAVFKCVGAEPQAREEMWKRIYSEWLPQAKYEILQSVSSHIIYSCTRDEINSPDNIFEIWLPVKKK